LNPSIIAGYSYSNRLRFCRVEHTEAAQVAALLGGVGAALVLLPRGRLRLLVLPGFALLGLATVGLAWALVGDDDVELLLTEPAGLALLGVGLVAVVLGAIPFVRHPAIVPVALLAAAPFRIPVELGEEEAFLLLPLYLVLSSSVLALGYRVVRGANGPEPPLLLALPLAAFVGLTSASYLWTWDERAGAIALAFFVFPFTAGTAVVARAPLAAWLPRALLGTVVALGAVFAAIGIWQAQTRTLFFARDVEVANAYTTFFRVTSLFKDPSLYGRYLVVPIAILLVAVLLRRSRTVEWVAAAAACAFLFWGLFYSYSQSSFVALFVVTFAVALVGMGKRLRIVLLACALVATLAAGAVAAESVNGRSAKDVTSGRSRLVDVTVDAFEARPVWGVGVGGQPRASAEESGRGSPSRNASHTTPLTMLAELGVLGFALYAWLLAATAWALYLLSHSDRTLAVGLAAVFLTLVVHSLLYAGFFEDPLTWGVFGLTAAGIASATAVRQPEPAVTEPLRNAPQLLAH
jgi:O-Antigen ligase